MSAAEAPSRARSAPVSAQPRRAPGRAPGLLGRPLLLAFVAGCLQGAILLGLVVSLLHVVHDRLPSVWSAAVLLAFSSLVYGLWCGGSFLAVAAVLRAGAALLERAGRRRAAGAAGAAGAVPTDPARRRARELTAAGFAFYLAFLFFVANYGLTYGEVPFGEPETAWGMAGYMALRTLLAAAVAAVAGWLLARWAVAAAGGRRAAAGAVAALWLLLAGVQLVLAGVYRPAGAEQAELPAAPELPEAPATVDAGYKVVVVGLDGADWRVLEPLMEAGQMPHFSRLVEEGASGSLATLADSNSAVLWASIYTGLAPAEHRVLDFYTVRVAGMSGDGVYPVHRVFFKEIAGALESLGVTERLTIDRSELEAPLLWEIASTLGRSIGVVDGYYYSYPAPPLEHPESFYVAYGADRLGRRMAESRRPPERVREAAEYVRPPELLGRIAQLLTLGELDWQAATLLELLDGRPQPALINFYAHEPDAVFHWTWRYWEPERFFGVPPEEVEAERDRIPELHRRIDAFLGALMERLDDDTVLMVISDHGHSPTLFHAMDTQHRHGPPGIVVLHGPPVRRGALIEGAHIYDVLPTALRLLGLPVPQDAAGRVLEEAFTPDLAERLPQVSIPTYRGLVVPAAEGGEGGRDAERRREELEKLRSLGYIQ